MAGIRKAWSWRKLALAGVAAGAALLAGGCNNDVKTENEALKTQLAQTQTERDQNRDLLAQAEARNNEMRAQMDQMSREKAATPPPAVQGGDAGKPDKTPKMNKSEDVVIEIAGDVLFGPGSDVLTAAGKKELDGVAKTIKNKHSGNRIRVEGYTDSDPIKKSKWPSNEALSLARAQAVEKYLASKGISDSRMSSVGRGAANPKKTKAASRRVEIHILAK